jgi:hypothetical protein
LFLQ